jgi:hypothetical protein
MSALCQERKSSRWRDQAVLMPETGHPAPRGRVTRLLGTPWQNCVLAGVNRTVAPETHLRKNRTFRAVERCPLLTLATFLSLRSEAEWVGGRPMIHFKFKHIIALFGTGALALASLPAINEVRADQGGVSFYVYYHTNVSAGAGVALAREFQIGKIPVNLSANLSANVNATGDLGIVIPNYTFATPVLGGQLSVGALAMYGNVSTSLAGTLTGTLTAPGGSIPFMRSDNISDTAWGFGDVVPIVSERWNFGVHNVMTYITGDIPVGAYDSTRLSNIGLGHGAVDAGGGYTYFNPQTGHELSAVLGFTYNLLNPSTDIRTALTCISIGLRRSS